MKTIVKTDEYTIYQKRNERYAVRDADRAWINGERKVAILSEHKLITAPPPPAAPVDEPAADEAAEAQADSDAATEASAAEESAEAADAETDGGEADQEDS